VTPVTPVTPEISFQPADSLWRGACTKFIPVRLTRPSSTCGHVRCTRACNTCARLHRPVILSSAPLTLSLSKHLQPVHRMCDTIPDCTFIMPHIQFAVACACALDRCSIPQKLPVSRLDLCEEGLVPEPFGLADAPLGGRTVPCAAGNFDAVCACYGPGFRVLAR
jgi:hypothetical protein